MITAIKNLFGLGPKVNYGELIANGAVVIDVRTKREFAEGHVKGSVNIPLDVLQNNTGKLKKEQVIITCCASGMRSAGAKSLLKSKGFLNVHNGGSWHNLKSYGK